MKEMKHISGRLIKTLLAAAMLVLMIGVTASAAGAVKVNMQVTSSGAYSYTGAWEDYDTTAYHKIYVPSSGALVVMGNNVYKSLGTTGSMRVELYNSKLKRVDVKNGQYLNGSDYYAAYGVKKGTYYIKTTGYKDYVLVAAFQKVTNTGGTSKAKAKTISRNKLKMGVMPAGESYKATDWYKFKVTSRKVLNLEIETAGTGYFDFYLYGPSYSKGIKICSLKNSSGKYYSINTRTYGKTKVKTGTYYIKAVRSKSTTASKKGSGIYSIKWYLN